MIASSTANASIAAAADAAPTAAPSSADATSDAGAGYASLTGKDFLKMFTAEPKNQDPTAPVDQQDRLAQMAQFPSPAGINTGNVTLEQIADKLDALIAAHKASIAASEATAAAAISSIKRFAGAN